MAGQEPTAQLPWFVLDPVLNWGVPFIVLLPRAAKRKPSALLTVSAVVLIGRWLSLYLIAAPAVLPAPRLGILELVMTAGFGGLAFLAATRSFAAAPLIARNDPFLAESLQHQA